MKIHIYGKGVLEEFDGIDNGLGHRKAST